MPIHSSDWRLVNVGRATAQGPARHKHRVVLRVSHHVVHVGSKLKVHGKVRGSFSAKARVRLMVRTGRHWHLLRRKPLRSGGTFATNPRLHGARLHGARVVRIRAVVKGVGRSNVVRIRVRR
jgi:hypothetical protein